ncbi:hypothetical protein [Magnetospirillum sp. UT-4]|uniref:hypothetical protein n=1 Tax=Magnetospirillum sp. UT-4 TaxID=2681467 RepID=UPI0013839A3A|nr:hypothetical protein [Magnetospirillum sp. UT-4]CAA7625711.1 hypothetical protein MTBUT4_70085 [Magnetospirillum sp. UT-4]
MSIERKSMKALQGQCIEMAKMAGRLGLNDVAFMLQVAAEGVSEGLAGRETAAIRVRRVYPPPRLVAKG